MEMICNKCGNFHDDGTRDYCFFCLDDMSLTFKDVREQRERSFFNCMDCNSTHLALSSVNGVIANCVCLDCGLITPFAYSDIFKGYKITAHCGNCKYSYSFDDSPDDLFCSCKDSEAYDQLINNYFNFDIPNKHFYCRCHYHVWVWEPLCHDGLPF